MQTKRRKGLRTETWDPLELQAWEMWKTQKMSLLCHNVVIRSHMSRETNRKPPALSGPPLGATLSLRDSAWTTVSGRGQSDQGKSCGISTPEPDPDPVGSGEKEGRGGARRGVSETAAVVVHL